MCVSCFRTKQFIGILEFIKHYEINMGIGTMVRRRVTNVIITRLCVQYIDL